jgi:hypothetical protein
MIEYEGFLELAAEIEAQGIERETALHYAGLMGDTPDFDEAGNLVVTDHGRELARLKPLKFFE